jgi:MFS family permease
MYFELQSTFMKKDKDYIQDIADIRNMMERSSKFLSLSGWAGIMAGLYALAGIYVAVIMWGFRPDSFDYYTRYDNELLLLASAVLLVALVTAVLFSFKKASKSKEKIWNSTTKRLLSNLAVPLVSGGIVILVLMLNDLHGLLIPLSLVFYGLALYSGSKFTLDEVRVLGLSQLVLGLLSILFISQSIYFWAIGFGLVHIIYGIYMHIRYER